MATIRLDAVSKEYALRRTSVSAVTDLTLDAADGELLVIVGPSGCGKTTTLRMIAGLESPTSGSVFIGDACVDRVAPRDRDVAMVFQNHALYPHMTVYKNMAFGLRMRRYPKREIDQRVREAATKLGLEHLLDRKPAALSGGECQRVAVGRAIVRQPKVFLLDEPFSNLDARLRSSMRTELKRLHQALGTTMIHVTHDQEEAMTLGNRIAVMSGGRLQQCETPQTVYDKPANRFVAEFVGMTRMNFIEGALYDADTKPTFACTMGRWALPDGVAKTAGRQSIDRVVLGVRPEHCRVVRVGSSPSEDQSRDHRPDWAVAEGMRVVLTEPLGDTVQIHVTGGPGSTGGQELAEGPVSQWIAKMPADRAVDPADRIQLLIDLSHAHLFHADGDGERM